MINSSFITGRWTTTLNSDSDTSPLEGVQSEYASLHSFFVDLTADSSLVGGVLRIEIYSPNTNTWVLSPQNVYMLASGGGSPAGIHENTTSATLTANGVVANSKGVTNITSTGTFILTAPGLGTKARLVMDASSGSATATVTYIGQRPVSF